jgi:hypothetical protein
MSRRRRLLVDVREDENLRGFHVLASLQLIADRLRDADLYRLGGNAADESVACQAFSFDTGLKFRSHWTLILVDSKFDLYVAAANGLPHDPQSRAGRRTSRWSVLGLMFEPQVPSLAMCDIVDGLNTAAIGKAVADALFAAAGNP